MKMIRVSFLMVLVCLAALSLGQGRPIRRFNGQGRPAVNAQSVMATEQALEQAIGVMTSALPIYDGNRVRSIHAAHRALVILEHISSPNKQERAKPNVTDHVPSVKAHTRYSQAQISASQSAMQQGLQALQSAAGSLQGNQPRILKAGQAIQTAISEANAALAIHHR